MEKSTRIRSRSDRAKCVRFAFVAALIGWATTSCATLVDNQVAASLGTNDLVKLDVLERQWLEYRIAPNDQKRDELDKRVQKTLEAKSYNKVFHARLLGLAAEIAWDKRDTRAVRKWAETIVAVYPREARQFVSFSRLEKNPARKVEILQTAIDQNLADVPAWLHLELALNAFEARQFRKAALEFDEALGELDGDWRLVYAKARDAAFALRDQQTPSIDGGSSTWGFEKQIDAATAIRVCLQESRWFDAYDWDAKTNAEAAFRTLKDEGFFVVEQANAPLSRSDVALFFFRLYVRQKQAADLLTQPLGFRSSPIPDVPMSEPALRAIIYWVQRDVMELPDGERFFPSSSVSSVEFLTILDRLKKIR